MRVPYTDNQTHKQTHAFPTANIVNMIGNAVTVAEVLALLFLLLRYVSWCISSDSR